MFNHIIHDDIQICIHILILKSWLRIFQEILHLDQDRYVKYKKILTYKFNKESVMAKRCVSLYSIGVIFSSISFDFKMSQYLFNNLSIRSNLTLLHSIYACSSVQ